MIPEQQTQNTVVNTIIGEEISFSVKSLANIFELLHKSMYNDKPTAVAREIISNAIDANIEAGSKKKIIVKFPTRMNQMFTVQDFGIGIDKERLKCFSEYGNSTKTNTNKEIGGFGLGAKSPWSITDQFTITTITSGIKYKYLCYMDETGVGKVKELFAIPTDEGSGTTMEIPVTNSDYIDRIKKQTQLFWLCNTDKIEMDGEPELDITTTLQHKVALRGFLPSNYHVFDWARYNISNCIVVLNGYVPYIINHLNRSEFDTGKAYTYLVKYDIGVLDIPATRETISDTPKNNRIVMKIKPTIVKGIKKLLNFLMLRKEKNEELGSITYIHSPIKLPQEYINKNAIYGKYFYSDREGCIVRAEGKYHTPTSPGTRIISDEIVVMIDDSKKYNVSFANYAEHIIGLNKNIRSVYFVYGNMIPDRTRDIFKVVPLHGFSPTPIKRQVLKKTADEKENQQKIDNETKFRIINTNIWLTVEEINETPENFRKIECIRNSIVDDSLKRHIDELQNDKCACKYNLFMVNKTEMKLFKAIKPVSESDFTLSLYIYKHIIAAYMMRFASIKLKKQKTYESRMINVIIDFLQKNSIIPYNLLFLDYTYGDRCKIKKSYINTKTTIYKIDDVLIKDYKTVAYDCVRKLLTMLTDVKYAYTIHPYNTLREELLEEYSNNLLDIFQKYKEMFK